MSTITAAAIVATAVVTFYLAWRQSCFRLRVFADINRYISPEAQRPSAELKLEDAPQMTTVTIIIVGPIPVSIHIGAHLSGADIRTVLSAFRRLMSAIDREAGIFWPYGLGQVVTHGGQLRQMGKPR